MRLSPVIVYAIRTVVDPHVKCSRRKPEFREDVFEMPNRVIYQGMDNKKLECR